MKRDLEIRYDYSTLSAYRAVDRYNDGRIDTFNLGSFLRGCGHYATETELLAIVRRIDTDGDARLSYSEFAEFLRSSNPPTRSVLEESDRAERAASAERNRRRMATMGASSPLRPATTGGRAHSETKRGSFRASSPIRDTLPRYSPVVETLPRYTSPVRKPILPLRDEDELVQGIRDMIRIENDLESHKTQCALKSDFNLTDAFKIFDRDYRGTITSYELRDGLSAIGVFPSSDEVDLFITRYDTTGDRRLNMREFSEALLALDPYYASMVNRRPSNHRYPTYRRDDCFLSDT